MKNENRNNTQTMSPTITPDRSHTYHRDQTVSYWDVLSQQWVRDHASHISSQQLTTMTDGERERITSITNNPGC